MSTSMKLALVTALILGFAAVGCAWNAEGEENGELGSTKAPLTTEEEGATTMKARAYACAGADPIAALDFTVLSRPADVFGTGSIRITASVKNAGNAAFASTANQHVELYGRGPGGRYYLLETHALGDLGVNASTSFEIERAWSPNYEPWETFKVVIVYGAGPSDDCFLGNNVRERSREEINALFH